jgi:hypothetical protein
MKKEFITYEQALALNQLGFDELCLSYYEGESFSYRFASIEGDDYVIPAPLFQQAFRWFRDKHNLTYHIVEKQKDLGKFYGGEIIKDGETFGKSFGSNFKTYEEAEHACLKELIEIVKNR